ncbi:hypothetical protein [Flavobacterium sp.]|uniref:hypothetical protein n=1 Tax=Flavobacterium sp. TaxID=239 RepID=UPI0012045FB2|nr:hypothetical protein [Flavobacterium sp.]RZJ69155.1 MAG: hypothetical protein EOO49_18475 [Flavobacterium sp.]
MFQNVKISSNAAFSQTSKVLKPLRFNAVKTQDSQSKPTDCLRQRHTCFFFISEFLGLSGRVFGSAARHFWFFCCQTKELPAGQATNQIQSKRRRSRRKTPNERSSFFAARELKSLGDTGNNREKTFCG